MDKVEVRYFRYMDDILILAPTRWKLRKAIRVLNQTFNEFKLEKHPDKTVMGRIEKSFDFLGYHFGPEGLTVAEATVQRFVKRAARLYEQEPGEPDSSSRLGQYVRRWLARAGGGGTRSVFATAHSANHCLGPLCPMASFADRP